jgi:hypothetical protein
MPIQWSLKLLIDECFKYQSLAIVITTFALIALTTCYFRWSSLIRKRLNVLHNSTLFYYFTNRTDKGGDAAMLNHPFRMIRCSDDGNKDQSKFESLSSKTLSSRINMLALSPTFVKQHEGVAEHGKQSWQLMSLGEYISSLRPYLATKTQRDDHLNLSVIPHWLETEIQAALAMALLGALGPRLGTVVLPTLGLHIIRKTASKIVSAVSSYVPGNNNVSKSEDETDQMDLFPELFDLDQGGIPVSISTMSTAAELNYQQYKAKRGISDVSNHNPLDLLRIGEVGYEISFGAYNSLPTNDPSKTSESNESNYIIPNPFILLDHWHASIQRMEQLLKQNDIMYNAHSYSMNPPPKPIDDRWFPDLYIGWGNALCTHSQRQILQNRLMATILNRLAYNYHMDYNFQSEHEESSFQPFIVKMSSTMKFEAKRPHEFIALLIESGHLIETYIQTQPTTFGMALCIRNAFDTDNDWTNIPLAYFLENGLSDINGNESYVCLPHSGLNMNISGGSFVDTVNIQHYMAIEGLCGWHSNHCAVVPWILPTVSDNSIRRGHESLESIRIAGLQAVIFNTVGTRYELPFGGYGLTGVCNDSAAQIECAISDDGMTTTIFPLTFHGKFAMHTLRVASELRCALIASEGTDESTCTTNTNIDAKSLDRLIHAILTLPSDTNSAPIIDTIQRCHRYLHSHSRNPPFQLLVRSRDIVESIQNELIQIRNQSAILKKSIL